MHLLLNLPFYNSSRKIKCTQKCTQSVYVHPKNQLVKSDIFKPSITTLHKSRHIWVYQMPVRQDNTQKEAPRGLKMKPFML